MKAAARSRSAVWRGLVLAAAFAAGGAPGLAADSFYADRLREGGLALERGEALRAARELRLACFGLLDEPRLLGECLARLALAEDKLGNVDGFRETYRRLSEVEERFAGYSQSALPAETRAQLEKRAAAVLPAAFLQQSAPALRPAAGAAPSATAGAGARREAPDARASRGTGAAGGAAPGAGASPARPRPAAPTAPPPAAGGAAAVPPAAPPAAVPSGQLTAGEQERLAEVRQTLSQAADGRALASAFEAAREVADARPASAEAQHLAAEAAYRIKRFKESAEYFRRGGDPGDGAAELLFYQAVALFEQGNRAEAANALKRALPNLRRTPYVDGYAKKILDP